jgi:Flp pilus assembly protein CpaB
MASTAWAPDNEAALAVPPWCVRIGPKAEYHGRETVGKRANLLVIVGLVVFLLGGAAVLMLVKDDGVDSASAGSADVIALFATEDIPAGTAGSEAVARGAVQARRVSGGAKAPDALSGAGELVGKVFTLDVEKGAQVRTAVVRNETLRSQAIDIPDGKQAVAVQVPFVPGVAGYVGTGDVVNVYALVQDAASITTEEASGAQLTANPRLARQLVSGVTVLDVSQEVAPRRVSTDPNEPRPVGNDIVYLLAVDPTQAEQLIFTTAYETMWLTLAEKEHPAAVTPGRTYTNLFQ